MRNKGNNTYYALVTSLPTISMEQSGEPDYRNLANDFKGFLSSRDYNWLQQVYFIPDIKNFTAQLFKMDRAWLPGGNFDKSQIVEAALNKTTLFDFQDTFFTYYNSNLIDKPIAETEKFILQLYYSHLIHCGNNFLENWGRLSLALNNYVLLLYAENLKIDLSDELIILSHQNVKPTFRILEQELNEHIQTAAISDVVSRSNILIKEKYIDTVKWNYLEASTFFEYFSLEKLICFALQNQLANRWKNIGGQMGKNITSDILKTII